MNLMDGLQKNKKVAERKGFEPSVRVSTYT